MVVGRFLNRIVEEILLEFGIHVRNTTELLIINQNDGLTNLTGKYMKANVEIKSIINNQPQDFTATVTKRLLTDDVFTVLEDFKNIINIGTKEIETVIKNRINKIFDEQALLNGRYGITIRSCNMSCETNIFDHRPTGSACSSISFHFEGLFDDIDA